MHISLYLGVCGVPYDVVATAAYNALMRFDSQLSASQEKHLTDIYFVNVQEEITCCMIDTFKKFLQLSSLSASTYDHSCEKFHQVDTKTILITLIQPKITYCLSTFRLHVGSLHQDLLPVPVVSM